MCNMEELAKEFKYQDENRINGVAPMHYEGEQDGLKITTNSHLGGINWKFTNKKGQVLSVICHTGSYGRHSGLFEVMEDSDDDVDGHLTFGEVQEKINLLRLKGEEDENGCVL